MAEGYLKRILIAASTGGGDGINDTSSLTGIYKETISVNDPVYSI